MRENKSAEQSNTHSLSLTTHHQALDGVVFHDQFALLRTGVGQLHEGLDRPFLHVGVGRRDQPGQVLCTALFGNNVTEASNIMAREGGCVLRRYRIQAQVQIVGWQSNEDDVVTCSCGPHIFKLLVSPPT